MKLTLIAIAIIATLSGCQQINNHQHGHGRVENGYYTETYYYNPLIKD